MSWGDLAAVAALLSTLCGGGWILFNSVRAGAATREDYLTRRERSHDEAVDRKLEEFETKLALTDRKYLALFGAVTVMVDRMILRQPLEVVLDAMEGALSDAFPVIEERPPEITLLLLRFGARGQPDGESE